jgi:hypothetical protein
MIFGRASLAWQFEPPLACCLRLGHEFGLLERLRADGHVTGERPSLVTPSDGSMGRRLEAEPARGPEALNPRGPCSVPSSPLPDMSKPGTHPRGRGAC